MTVDEQLRIELTDVLGIEIECGGCHTRVTFQPVNWKPETGDLYCPGCQQAMWLSGTGEYRNIRDLAAAFRALTATSADAGKTRVRFQLAWPPKGSPKT